MPSSSFRAIVKQISKLHEAIRDLLPPHQMKVGRARRFVVLFCQDIIIISLAEDV